MNCNYTSDKICYLIHDLGGGEYIRYWDMDAGFEVKLSKHGCKLRGR